MRGRWPVLLALLLSVAAARAQEVSNEEPITRVAFGSCNKEYKPQPLWKPILACKPDVWIWLGDIIYGDADDLSDLARRFESEKKKPEYQALRRESKILGVWDDADFGTKDGGKENPHKVEAQKILLDFLDEPPESPRRKQAGVYAAYTLGPPGKQVKVMLLDGRFHREKPGKSSDILGAEQWSWLEQELASSRAEINFIGSGSQVIASEHPYEKWADYPQARQRLFDLIAKTKARNVIFLSGDRHLGEISRMTDPRIPQPLYDITSSGMTHHAENNFFHNFNNESNQFRLGKNYVALNFGLVEIDWSTPAPTVTLQVRGVDNVVAVEQKIALAPSEAAHP